MSRSVILGLGNILNCDEGVGVHALKALETRCGSRVRAEVIDGGTMGLSLLPLVEECDDLLVLDAIDARRAPGSLVELARDEIPLFAGVRVSQHQVTFQEVLGLAMVRGKLPRRLHLLGIQPGDTSLGIGLSAVAEAALPRLIARALEILQDWDALEAV